MSSVRKILLFIGDSAMFILAAILMLIIRYGWPVESTTINSHVAPLVWLYILWIIIFYIFNLYDSKFARPTAQTTRNILLGLGTALLSGFLLFYLNPFPISPKTNLLILVGIFGILFFLWRLVFFRIFKNNFRTKLVAIGNSLETELLIKEIQRNPQLGYVFVERCESISESMSKLGSAGLVVYEKHLSSSEIEKLASTNIQILHIREAFQNILYRIPVHLVDDSFAVRTMERKSNILYRLISRTLEIVIAIFILTVTLPVTILAVIARLLEDGSPIFFNHERIGLHGKTFKIIKLRSMVKDAEKNGAVWAENNDHRITRVGKIIRKTHVDEIPQMWNIIRGDISLVGPRPERPLFVSQLEKEIPYYFLRHTIKPGFTGWAQIMFRYARSIVDSQKKFEYDLYYVKNKNFFLDIGILLKTVQIIFTH